MKKTVKLSETELVDLVKKVIDEQSNPILPLETRLKFAREKYLKFLESSLRSLKPNEANELPNNDDELLVNILEQTGNLLKMTRDLALEKSKTKQPSFQDMTKSVKK